MAESHHHRKQGFGLVCWVLIGLARQEEGVGEEGRSKRHRGTRVTKGYQGLLWVTESGLPRLPRVAVGYQGLLSQGYQGYELKAQSEGRIHLRLTTAN